MYELGLRLLFLFPSATALLISALFYSAKSELTITRRRDLIGLVLLALFAVWHGYIASRNTTFGLVAVSSALPATIVSLVTGSALILAFRKWRKLLGLIIAFAFPTALLMANVIGFGRPTKPLTVGESALQTTRELLEAVSYALNDTPSYLWVDDGCWFFLRESLAVNSGDYTLTLLSAYDSTDDPYAVHSSTETWVQVDFPDKRQAKLWVWNGGVSECQYSFAGP